MTTRIKRDGTVELVDGNESIAIGRVEKYEFRTTHYCSGAYSRVASGYSYQVAWKCFAPGGRRVCDALRTRAAAVRVLVDEFDSGRI